MKMFVILIGISLSAGENMTPAAGNADALVLETQVLRVQIGRIVDCQDD